jgi:hypothetical protein
MIHENLYVKRKGLLFSFGTESFDILNEIVIRYKDTIKKKKVMVNQPIFISIDLGSLQSHVTYLCKPIF